MRNKTGVSDFPYIHMVRWKSNKIATPLIEKRSRPHGWCAAGIDSFQTAQRHKPPPGRPLSSSEYAQYALLPCVQLGYSTPPSAYTTNIPSRASR